MISCHRASVLPSLQTKFEGSFMSVVINRLDPNVPDPVESRRRAAGRLVRMAYAAGVFSILGFFVIYFGSPFVFLGGSGAVSSPRHVISLPYTVQVSLMKVTPGAIVKAADEIAQVRSPAHDTLVATYLASLVDIASRSAELRVKARVAKDSLDVSRSYQRETEAALKQIEAMAGATTTFRLEILRERALANKAVITQEAEFAEATTQLA